MSYIVKEITSVKNLFILNLTLICYTVTLVLFFWFVISMLFNDVLMNKYNFLLGMLDDLSMEQKMHIIEVFRNISDNIRPQSINLKNERVNHNIEILQTDILPYIYTLCILQLLITIYMIHNKITFDIVDKLLTMFVIFEFIPEIIAYFVMIRNWEFIGDFSVYYALLLSDRPQ